jgi:hypothetical protein
MTTNDKEEDTMFARSFVVFSLIGALLLFSGCAGKETMLDKNWGKSFESAKSNQILDPEAGQNLDPVDRFDGQAAERAIGAYRSGFKSKAPGKAYTANPGNIGSTGKKK